MEGHGRCKAITSTPASITTGTVLITSTPRCCTTRIGYRHQGGVLVSTLTFYSADFKSRQATAFDAASQANTYTNVGRVRNRGVEVELGNTPINGWAFYGSFGYSKSEVVDDVQTPATTVIPIAGKEMPLTPKLEAGLNAE